MQFVRYWLLIGVLFSQIHTPVFAHSTGVSFEKVVDRYFIDIGYDSAQIIENVPVRFDFNVYEVTDDGKPGQTVEYTDIWVRMVEDRATVFASGIHNPDVGIPGMIYSFGRYGKYEMYVRFQNADEVVVETTFPLDVVASQETKDFKFRSTDAIFAVVGLLIGLIISSLIKRKQ